MEELYDIIGIGIGPFNLGLAALCADLPGLKSLFLDQQERFNWHPGMMLKNARLQVPFHADLVTLANPQSRYSYLCYLKARRRLFRFSIKEDYFPLRQEYNDYCGWVSEQLESLKFGKFVVRVYYDLENKIYVVFAFNSEGNTEVYYTKNVVIGIGALPYLPPVMSDEHAFVFHSSDYLKKRDDLDPLERITVVGSGQSAAEIFDDLLSSFSAAGKHLHWLTRADRIYPMDYSRFALEMTSPDYIDYFYKLSENKKNGLLKEQSYLYKGVNASLIDQIYHKLYIDDLSRVVFGKRDIRLSCELEKVDTSNDEIKCYFKHKQTLAPFTHSTDALIMATGYKYDIPEFLLTIKDRINWENNGRYKISRNYSIDNEQRLFVQNAELYSHGFNAPDLGMGPYRNAIILNTILNSNYFDIEDKIAFQNFD